MSEELKYWLVGGKKPTNVASKVLWIEKQFSSYHADVIDSFYHDVIESLDFFFFFFLVW